MPDRPVQPDEVPDGLPVSLAAAWGLRGRPARGPRPGLSLERIVEAAVKIAESEGLAAVSMGRVAAAVGASTMSLYRYVAAKDELLALMLDAATGPPPAEVWEYAGLRPGLTRWAYAVRAALRRHPWVLYLPLAGPPVTPNQIGWMECALRQMRGTGLDHGEKVGTLMLLSGYLWRESMLMAGMEPTAAGQGPDDKWQTMTANYGRILGRIVDPLRHVEVYAMVSDGVFDEPDEDPDADFVFGLERILDGVEALISARSAASGADTDSAPAAGG
jgi:AcrR family transcriptional regulator